MARFYDLNRKCDKFEDKRMKQKLNHIPSEIINQTTSHDFDVEKDNRVIVRGCCINDCNIF